MLFLCSFPPSTQFVVTPEGTKRPISPELAIWRFSNTAYLHVGHRITGCILSGGFILAGLYGLKSCDLPGAIDQIKIAAPLLVPVVKASVAFPLTYHLLGGYRQLYHDYTAKGLTAEFQDQSSMVMVAISGAITVIAAVVSYEEK